MDRRRIFLRDVNGTVIREWDVSELDNANAQAVMTITVETLCDMGEWHCTQKVTMQPWGTKLTRSEPA